MTAREDTIMEEEADENTVFQAMPQSPASVQDQMIISVEAAGQDVEQTSTSESQVKVDDRSGTYEWKVENFLGRHEQRVFSEKFEIGTYLWRILVFPRGNKAQFLSVYLESPEAAYTPLPMSPKASFKLSIINHLDPTKTFIKEAVHTFTQTETDWGFTSFLPADELSDVSKGFLAPDGSVTLQAVVNVQKDERYAYDSRQETGFVGLKNQGATCYMNSLLQYLFNLPYFRKAVYHMPTEEMDDPSRSIPLALQSLFYKQQYNSTSVSTKNLTKSFGWGTYDAFMQHDVQELNRVLCEKLEEKMKGTSVEKVINEMFEGNTCNYLRCINVEYNSSRKESFMDLQLDVKGCRDIYESFDKYVAKELMNGQNQYKAEGHGLQDAEKGVTFENFPPVLQLQLKRFEYDFQRDIMVKINDRYEFYDEIDLDRPEYFSRDADKSVVNRFKLHSVLVHSGGVHGGHYYAFIRPDGKTWLKFDDDRVTIEDSKKAMDEQFGGEDENPLPLPAPTNFSGGGINMASNQPNNAPAKFAKFSNAYMLVYIRLSDWDRIMCPVTKEDIALHLRERFECEQREKEEKQTAKQEAHLYCTIKIATDMDINEQIGKNTQFDLVDYNLLPEANVFRLKKQTHFSEIKSLVATRFSVPVHQQRFWTWSKRPASQSMRLNRPLSAEEETRCLMDLREFREQSLPAKKDALMDVKLYLELPRSDKVDLRPLPATRQDVLLFIKVYDPITEQLRFLRAFYGPKVAKVSEIIPMLCKDWGLDPALQPRVRAYYEIKSEPLVECDRLKLKETLGAQVFHDGDILILQVEPNLEEAQQLRHPTVDKYLEYIRNRRLVNLRKLDDPKDAGTTLEMGKEMGYDEVTEHIARHLGLPEPSHLRLTQHNVYSHQPQRAPIKWRGIAKLETMLQHANHTNDVLYYEVLDIPLQELETLKTLKVSFHGQRTEFVSEHSIRLPRDSNVRNVLEELRKALGPEEYAGKLLRLMEVHQARIYKELDFDEGVDSINDAYWSLRAEVVPKDEQDEDAPGTMVIHVYHFHPDSKEVAGPIGPTAAPLTAAAPQQQLPLQQPQQQQQQLITNFGDPFFLRIRDNETLQEVKARIQAKLGVADEEFSKWGVAFVSPRSGPQFMKDDDIPAQHFLRASSALSSEPSYLGLQHEDKGPKRPQQGYRYTYERPVKIYN